MVNFKTALFYYNESGFYLKTKLRDRSTAYNIEVFETWRG
jgi:hypothetical protein